MNNPFSWRRLWAIIIKEFIQLKRDRVTFAMMIAIPLLQLTLFGFAINTDPKRLPTAIIAQEHTNFSRSFIAALHNSDYFSIQPEAVNEKEANRLLAQGDVQFVVTIPQDFSRKLIRGERPSLLLEADATDPQAVVNAVSAIQPLINNALRHDLIGPLVIRQLNKNAFDVILHRRYNPEGITQYNIVPGLMGVILTMTMIMMTALAVTREVERGTMENLLAMPVRPVEVMLGKIAPYVGVGFIQVTIIFLAAWGIFNVPFFGDVFTTLLCILIFICANLTVGITISSVARNQTQAMQMTFFFFLPSLLLSGFMFPFRGMPQWAQYIGEGLPLTHFLRLIRGSMLKGNGFVELWPNIWPLFVFIGVMLAIGLKRYRKTLD